MLGTRVFAAVAKIILLEETSMERTDDPLFFVGAMPPPLHGMSNINERMFAALSSRDIKIHLFDIARRRKNTNESCIDTDRESSIEQLVRFVKSMASVPGQKKTYLSLSGGLGQVRDLVFIVISRVFCAK